MDDERDTPRLGPPSELPADRALDATQSGSRESDDARGATKAPKRRRPETLVELYTAPKAAAPELLAVLAKRDAWITSAEDQDSALRLLHERDRDLAKTRTLAQHVVTTHDGRFAASFEAFLLQAVSDVLEGTPGWPPKDGSDGASVFQRLVEYHSEALSAKEPARRLFNAVMIAQAVLMARYGLDIQHAVPILSRTLGPPVALRRERTNPRLVRLRALGDTRLTVDALRTWLDVLTPWIERAIKAEKSTDRAHQDVARLQAVTNDLEGELAALREQLAATQSQVVELRQEVQEKADRERGVTLARQHEGSQLRGTMAGFLEDDVLTLLAAIGEALKLDPPRVPYSLERLEDAEHEIQDRVRWLRSSD